MRLKRLITAGGIEGGTPLLGAMDEDSKLERKGKEVQKPPTRASFKDAFQVGEALAVRSLVPGVDLSLVSEWLQRLGGFGRPALTPTTGL